MSAPAPFQNLGHRRYRAIYADPPWHFRARTALQTANWTSRRDVERHYPTMSLRDIRDLPVRELASPEGCHLFLWITGPMIVQGAHLEVMDAWGFRPSSIAFTWLKLARRIDSRQFRMFAFGEEDMHVGLGLTTRKNTEFCLLGRRGNASRRGKDVREVLLSPVREHSRKPDAAYERIERYCDGPYCELFAREARSGWDCWGDELPGGVVLGGE